MMENQGLGFRPTIIYICVGQPYQFLVRLSAIGRLNICIYPNTNFSQIGISVPIPHDLFHLCGFSVLFWFPQRKPAFLGRAFFAVVPKRTVGQWDFQACFYFFSSHHDFRLCVVSFAQDHHILGQRTRATLISLRRRCPTSVVHLSLGDRHLTHIHQEMVSAIA